MTATIVRPKKSRALKFGVATIAAAALALGSSSSALAADHQLGPDDIIGFENGAESSDGYNYDQWHIGSVYGNDFTSTDSLEFGDCSVTTLAVPTGTEPGASVTQVLKGFPIDARPTADPDNGITDIQALIESISIDVAEGHVTLQLPFFLYWEGDLDDQDFATFRNAESFGPGVHTLDGAGLSATGFASGGTYTDYVEILGYMQDGIDADGQIYELLGVGFTGSPGAVINSISFGGDTYYFGTGGCLPVQDNDADDADSVIAPLPPERVDTGL